MVGCIVLWAIVSMFGTVSRTASGWTDQDRAIMLRGVETMEDKEQVESVKVAVEQMKADPQFAGEQVQAALDRIASLVEAR